MATELESIRMWYLYNRVARQGYFATLAKLPPEELVRDRGASFPTMLDILGHSIGGIETWVTRMAAAQGHPFNTADLREPQNLEDLRKFNETIDRWVDELFARLTDADLDRSFLVPKLPPWWDEDFTTTFRGTLLHVIEHELQHRGELNALLWQIDVEPPILDWDEFVRKQSSSARSPPAHGAKAKRAAAKKSQ